MMSSKIADNNNLTGRSHFGRNVVFAWGGYAVNIVAGFVMPRLISDRLGQSALGVWDFSWSMVTYFGLLQLGLGGSINRYVARYRAAGDVPGLCRSVSTIDLSMKTSGLLVALVTLIAFFWIVPLFSDRLGAETGVAAWVVFWLGLEIAISLFFSVYYGTLTGCHRWDVHNTVSSLTYVGIALGMIMVLLLGGGLVAISFVHCLFTILGEVVRMRFARRACPELRLDFRLASWSVWLEQARFSVKSLVPRFAEMISNQSLSFLVTMHLGPSQLAVYFRPQNLLKHGNTLAAKFGFILVPTASSLQAQSDLETLQRTFRQSIHQIACLGFPLAVGLGVAGDYVISLWMGPSYVYPGLIAIMAVAAVPAWIHEPVWSILAGLNQHGRIGWVRFAASCVSSLALFVAFTWFQAGLLQAALAFLVPQFLVDLAVTPRIACRRLGLPVSVYYRQALWHPLLLNLPYGLLLFFASRLFPVHPAWALGLALAAVLALGICYWFYVLPDRLRRGLCVRLGVA